MSESAPSPELVRRARERLRAAGLADERIGLLLERTVQLLACLDAVAALDAELPEPALTWQPGAEVSQ